MKLLYREIQQVTNKANEFTAKAYGRVHICIHITHCFWGGEILDSFLVEGPHYILFEFFYGML